MNIIQTNKRFALQMAILATAFDKNGLTKEKISLYHEFLKDINLSLIEKAVTKLIKTRRFSSMPTIAEIRDAALSLDDDQLEIQALKAWEELNTRLICGNPGRGLLAEAVKLAFGSWEVFENGNHDNDSYDQRQFVKSYKILLKLKKDGLLLDEAETKEVKELEDWKEYQRLHKENKKII